MKIKVLLNFEATEFNKSVIIYKISVKFLNEWQKHHFI